MKNDVILHFKDGQKLEVRLARPFRSEENELKIIMADAEAQSIFLVDEQRYSLSGRFLPHQRGKI